MRQRGKEEREKKGKGELTVVRLALDKAQRPPGLVQRVLNVRRQSAFKRPTPSLALALILTLTLARARARASAPAKFEADDPCSEERVAESKEGPDGLEPGRGEELGFGLRGGEREAVMKVPAEGRMNRNQ